jgi:two-component system osmolarity sensor histidine kinase EnvZ
MIGKAYLPKSLFGRTLLIVVAPTVLIQIVMAYVFFDRHWDYVTRQMSKALAGDAAFLVMQLKRVSTQSEWRVISDFEEATGIQVGFDDEHPFAARSDGDEFVEFQEQLKSRINEPFSVRKAADGDTIEIRIKLEDHILRLLTTIKRLESRTTLAFMAWMLGVSALFLFIAVLFLRNQIRPMHRLAEAAENFGRGMDTPNFRPHGATEVRKAAKAFIIMRERLKRQIRTRTDMLSGISHDLRTPLTRMKLQLAMMEKSDAIQELGGDVQQMEHMIAEYLDFVRGEGREEALSTDLTSLLKAIVSDYQRTGKQVTLKTEGVVKTDLRVSSFRRMLHNLIDNAIRHGKQCDIAISGSTHNATITIDDDGPGIPEDKREEVFRPFARLDLSRNVKTGGVGLGLTIARDVALAHGGSISLASSPSGGLRVIITLPI